MKRLSGIAAFAIAAVLSASSLAATPSVFAPEFGRSLPPVGFVKFCAKNPGECRDEGRRAKRMELTPQAWTTLFNVNRDVNKEITPVSDADLYGVPEFWTYPTTAGDCEDYLLLKKRDLEKLGFEPGSLLITVVLDEKNEGHAVLTVATDRGDFVLDNRRNDILVWGETGYTFLKRQSQKDPRAWVALSDGTQKTVKATAGSN
jgi:predicted transglutaminase-like cysteine proteinase